MNDTPKTIKVVCNVCKVQIGTFTLPEHLQDSDIEYTLGQFGFDEEKTFCDEHSKINT